MSDGLAREPMSLHTGYINTDLVVVSSSQLPDLVERLESSGLFSFGLFEVDGLWQATFEAEVDYESPESAIVALVGGIEK